MIHVIAFAVTFLLCTVYVISVGGMPERLAMLAQFVAFLFSLFAISFRWIRWAGMPAALMIADLGLAITLTAIALKANRRWPILLAGMQVATVFAHLAKVLSVPLPAVGYAVFVQFWGWPMLFVTAAGAYNHHRRLGRIGQERDWKPLWPESPQVTST